MRRRLLFVTARVITPVAAAATMANRPAVAAPSHATTSVRPFAWGCEPCGDFGQCTVPNRSRRRHRNRRRHLGTAWP